MARLGGAARSEARTRAAWPAEPALDLEEPGSAAVPRYLAPVRCTPSGSAGHDHAFALLDDGAGSGVPTVDGMEAVALQLHAADARLLGLEPNTATQPRPPGRTQAAGGRRTVLTNSMHCEASGADLSVNRQHRAIGREHRSGFLNSVSLA